MITRILIALNLAAFVVEIFLAGPGMLFGGGNLQRVDELGALASGPVLQDHQWWRIVTSAFLHAGLLHIFVNMLSLLFLGRFIEHIAGAARMLLIYVVSMIAAGLSVVYLTPAQNAWVPVVGASGAIFGLFGALFAIGLKLGKPGMQLVRDNIGILVVNLIMTFAWSAISWQAHVGGLIAGFILTFAVYYPPKRVQPVVVDAATGAELESEYQVQQQPPQR